MLEVVRVALDLDDLIIFLVIEEVILEYSLTPVCVGRLVLLLLLL